MLGYFGPAGTFTHQALLSLDQGDGIPFATVGAALDAAAVGEVSAALVPIENSVEGGVSATLDTLASIGSLWIVREVLLPVQFGLFVRPGTPLTEVRRVLTHPHAAAQCRDWLRTNLPGAIVTEGGSTAGAAQEVSDPSSKYDAAVCAHVAGEMYGLELAADAIADNTSAVTRFVLVARRGQVQERTGADKTTLVAYMHEDHPGALLEILEQFATRGINLSRIESRPTKTTLGSYCFSIDADGHLRDARMSEALLGLKRVCKDVIFLGSYPRADRAQPSLARGTSDAEHEAAKAWLEGLGA
ncbi:MULTISPECIES: prephenate dehydratase [Aestuariimicrobium]|uniref:prephenate dehydratase n=1 Tax=Aestuariimicrobium TaxID=396388 RepID=UPI0003B7B89C|nr:MULTISPECIES: prephenate dehydratase [Aestuariimicrobium]CAI9402519.1 Prephenate dehydratase [Aestuariimicrobium sp. T2.26MG-19.2B]